MAISVFVTRDDVTDELNNKIERLYPGGSFDFDESGLPSEWISKIHNEGFSVKAVYTQADCGDWGTFVQIEPDFSLEEPDNNCSKVEWEKHESNLEVLDVVTKDWGERFTLEAVNSAS